jgi:hypothetical protein
VTRSEPGPSSGHSTAIRRPLLRLFAAGRGHRVPPDMYQGRCSSPSFVISSLILLTSATTFSREVTTCNTLRRCWKQGFSGRLHFRPYLSGNRSRKYKTPRSTAAYSCFIHSRPTYIRDIHLILVLTSCYFKRGCRCTTQILVWEECLDFTTLIVKSQIN